MRQLLQVRHRGIAPSAFHRDCYWSGFISACSEPPPKNGIGRGGGKREQPQWVGFNPVHRLTFASTLGFGRDNMGSDGGRGGGRGPRHAGRGAVIWVLTEETDFEAQDVRGVGPYTVRPPDTRVAATPLGRRAR